MMRAGGETASRGLLQRRCRWHRCRAPLQRAERASRRFCSGRCRMASHRAGHYARRLRACTVESIGRREGRAFIFQHELLGTVGNAVIFFGLRDPTGKLWSVVGFGHGPHAAGADIVLERGATRRRAPHNAASFLISRALAYGRRHLGWRTVKAFSDPRFGEAGIVYRAVGFAACPPSKHGNAFRYALVDGRRTLSDRAIYRRHGSHAGARAAGAAIVRMLARIAWEWRTANERTADGGKRAAAALGRRDV
jgi:hypothetical protein